MIRLPLIIARFVAFGFLCTAAVAAPTAATQREREREGTLADQATTQFDLAFRANPNEAQSRKEQLQSVITAWRTAPRTDANDERLVSWLRAAIRASMPGSHNDLPAAPNFADGINHDKPQATAAKLVPAVMRTPEPTLAVPTATPLKTDGQTDPFRDDPADMQSMK